MMKQLLIVLLMAILLVGIVSAAGDIKGQPTLSPVIKVPTLEPGVSIKTEFTGATPIKAAVDKITTQNGTAKMQAQMTAIRKSRAFKTPYTLTKEDLGETLVAQNVSVHVLFYYWNPVADAASFYVVASKDRKPIKMPHVIRERNVPYTVPVATSLDSMSKVRTVTVREDPKAAIGQMVGKYVEGYVK
jgi:hypothetical protein